jgi:hypothetical protein
VGSGFTGRRITGELPERKVRPGGPDNPWVVGSSPARPTVRTPDERRFHSPGTGIWRTVEDTLGYTWTRKTPCTPRPAGQRLGQGTVPPTPVGLRPVDLGCSRQRDPLTARQSFSPARTRWARLRVPPSRPSHGPAGAQTHWFKTPAPLARSGGWRRVAASSPDQPPSHRRRRTDPAGAPLSRERPTPQGRRRVASRSSQLDGWPAMKGTDR